MFPPESDRQINSEMTQPQKGQSIPAESRRRTVMKKFVLGMIVALASFGASVASAQKIALLDSDNTREFFRRRGYSLCGPGSNHIGELEYERYFRGWQYVLMGQTSNHLVKDSAGAALLPTVSDGFDGFDGKWGILKDKMNEFDITEAVLKSRGTEVLILSNLAGMTVEETREIKQWVLGGGKLIATYGSGYKDLIENPHDPLGADPLKSQKGSTGGLHELWHDPWTRAFGTQAFDPDPGVNIRVLKNIGPTAISGWESTVLSYGAEANLLVPRPEHFRDALAFLQLTPNPDSKKVYPAILLTRMSRGTVVYFSYAPEFIVALAFNLAGHCPLDGNYPAASPDWQFPAFPSAPIQVVGPVAADFPNKFVGQANEGLTIQVNSDRVRPQLLIMKRTIDFMLNGY